MLGRSFTVVKIALPRPVFRYAKSGPLATS